MFRYPFRLPFNHPFRAAFSVPGFGEPIPPISDNLLIQLTGKATALQMLDNWAEPFRENFDMRQSNCVTLNGVDEDGTLSRTITLVGDFKASAWVSNNTVAANVYVFGKDTSTSAFGFKSISKQLRCFIGGNFYEATSNVAVGPEPIYVSWERVGTELTFTAGTQTSTKTVVTDDIIIETFGQVTSQVALNGVMYDYRFQDATQDYHFRMAEGNASEFSYSSNFLTDGLYITWSGVLADIWAGRQDTYHSNVLLGWWEKAGDATRYPYPVSGFTTFHKGGTFNNCETAYGPETKPVGTGNGTDDLIQTTIVEDGAIDITCYVAPEFIGVDTGIPISAVIRNNFTGWRLRVNSNGAVFMDVYGGGSASSLTSIAALSNGVLAKLRFTYDGVNTSELFINGVSEGTLVKVMDTNSIPITIFARLENGGVGYTDLFQGIIRDVTINGRLIPIDEGEGIDIHDSEGNKVGEQAGDETFWAGAEMVSQEMGDAEAAAGINYLTDGKFHPLYLTQQDWGALGEELVVNGGFIYGGDDWSLGTGWSVVDGKAVQNGDGENDVAAWLRQLGVIEAGKTYEVSVDLLSLSGGVLGINDGGAGIVNLPTVGSHTQEFVATSSSINFVFSSGQSGTIDNISVREVNKVMNNNKQYYLTECEGKNPEVRIYKEPNSVEDDAVIKAQACIP